MNGLLRSCVSTNLGHNFDCEVGFASRLEFPANIYLNEMIDIICLLGIISYFQEFE